jgi:predicted nucleic acid-binding protein
MGLLPAIVIDASLAVARVREEWASPGVRLALRGWATLDRRLIAPAHFWYEVLNALTRGVGFAGAEVVEAVHDLDRLGIETIHPERPLLLLTLDVVERHRLTAYDALYLAVAQSMDAQVATLDRALAAAAGERAIYLGPDQPPGGRVAEAVTPYGTEEPEPTWGQWPGAARYLGTLRRRALAGERL